ncbi:MAG: YbgA family protein [Desulfovibrionaceae bacterium]
MPPPTDAEAGIPVGVSTCLLGKAVRFDGGHRLDTFILHELGRFFSFAPVCPEVECGLGVPREAMRLVGDPDRPRLVTVKSGTDHTERMTAWAAARVEELAALDLCGFIFKSKSPSSGMERVKVYPEAGGAPAMRGVGLFARAFKARFPLIPTEEDGRLHDPVLRENFISRVFTMRRWRALLGQDIAAPGARGRLVSFHAAHKLLVLSHDTEAYRALGRLVAHAASMPARELHGQYQEMLMAVLARKATPAKHANVLHHIMGYFKRLLTSDEKQELREAIDHYRLGHTPLVVPLTLCNHYVRKYGVAYLREQHYLHPHPIELALCNHV